MGCYDYPICPNWREPISQISPTPISTSPQSSTSKYEWSLISKGTRFHAVLPSSWNSCLAQTLILCAHNSLTLTLSVLLPRCYGRVRPPVPALTMIILKLLRTGMEWYINAKNFYSIYYKSIKALLKWCQRLKSWLGIFSFHHAHDFGTIRTIGLEGETLDYRLEADYIY